MRAAAKMAAATKIQNNFGKYLQYAMDSSEIIILKNGKQVAGIVSEEASISFLTDFFRRVHYHSKSEGLYGRQGDGN